MGENIHFENVNGLCMSLILSSGISANNKFSLASMQAINHLNHFKQYHNELSENRSLIFKYYTPQNSL